MSKQESTLAQFLADAERRTSFGNDHSAEVGGLKFWVGEPGSSRVHQFEATVLDPKTGRAVELRARTFAALARKITKAVKATP